MVSQVNSRGVFDVQAEFVEDIILESVNFPIFGPHHIYPIVFTQYRIYQLERIFPMYLFLTGQTINDPYRIGDSCHHKWERPVFNIGVFCSIGPIVERAVIQGFVPGAAVNGSPVAGHEGIKRPASPVGNIRHFIGDKAPSIYTIA